MKLFYLPIFLYEPSWSSCKGQTTNSVQKTLRKPAEQIKGLLAGGVASTRKFFKDIRATEVKFNGRSNENLILLKVR